MKTENKKSGKILKTANGMTLVEMLVAISLLALIIFCFMPLFMSYYQNIKTSGAIVNKNYTKVGLIEKLIGNTGSNSGYEYEVEGIPLQMSVKDKTGQQIIVKSKETENGSGNSQMINGNNIVATPDAATTGFTTFYANSVTSTMLCFPSHISDDFKEKTITVFASGFKFNNINELTLQYTGEDGLFYDVDKAFYDVSQPINSPGIVYLTLYGDNNQINFRTSPLKIQYPGRNDLIVEVDAPTIIMVGEETDDGKNYYYVSSGDVNDDGTMDVVAKTMDNKDYKATGQPTVKLTAAMNDIEWVSPEEGDGKNVDAQGNKYGYYVMCGDNGQIRRFWKDSTGKYFWGGDNTIYYDYSSVQPEHESNDHVAPTVVESKKDTYSTEAYYKYLFYSYPYAGSNYYNGDRTDGICLDRNSLGKLYTNTAFTINAADDPYAKFWAINRNLLYTFEGENNTASWGTDSKMDCRMYDRYSLNNNRALISTEGYDVLHMGVVDIGWGDKLKGFDSYFKVTQESANDITSYSDFWGENYSEGIVLTSVDTVKMNKKYSESNGNPTSSYTLYCGYIPAVVDLWSPTRSLSDTSEEYMFTRWLATLGVGYVEDDATLLVNYPQFRDRYISSKKQVRLAANVWLYDRSDSKSYALTGICGSENYSRSDSLAKALQLLDKEKENPSAYGIKHDYRTYPVYPLNGWNYQGQLQEQNTTQISIGYLSNPRAMGGLSNNSSGYDITVDARQPNVHQWTFDRGTTFLDTDSVTLEDESGNERNMSISVGYTLSGLETGFNDGVVVPTVMNCGVVYLRSGGDNNENWYSGGELNNESNIFHMFYYPSVYWKGKNDEQVLNYTSSAGYWRDILHPLYYSVYGSTFNPDTDDRYSTVSSHILFDKRLNCVSWGARWDSQPEAMWGASDGTVMNWGDITNSRYWNQKESDYNAESVRAEFQSYKWIEQAKKYPKVYYRWYNWIGTNFGCELNLPQSLSDATWCATDMNGWTQHWQPGWKTDLPAIGARDLDNAYLDCRSLYLYTSAPNGSSYKPNAYGFISPLDTIEDVTYADDIWVAVGCQGQINPTYCGTMAVERATGSGSWVAVRTWFDLSGGKDSQPCLAPNSGKNYQGSKTGRDNNFFLWHAVQISTIEHCNIVQVTNTGGMWYAVGYIDENDNNECDKDEKAVVFYAQDPSKACGEEGGWTLAKSSVSNAGVKYTQACHYNGSTWETVDISSINSMASRND